MSLITELLGLAPTELAWQAGFFDGEGTVLIRANRHLYGLLVQIVQTRNVFPPFQKAFGGTIQEEQPRPPGRRLLWKWTANGREAATFLRCVRPYLVVKAQEADIALAFFDWYSLVARHGREPLAAHLIDKARAYRSQLQEARKQ